MHQPSVKVGEGPKNDSDSEFIEYREIRYPRGHSGGAGENDAEAHPPTNRCYLPGNRTRCGVYETEWRADPQRASGDSNDHPFVLDPDCPLAKQPFKASETLANYLKA